MATAMPTGIAPGDLDLTIEPPQFADLVATTLGNLGTSQDGFDMHFQAMLDGFQLMQDTIAGGDPDLDAATQATPGFSEPFITADQQAVSDAADAGTADLATFDASFPNAPNPPAPPSGGGSTAGCGPQPTTPPADFMKWCCINGQWVQVPVTSHQPCAPPPPTGPVDCGPPPPDDPGPDLHYCCFPNGRWVLIPIDTPCPQPAAGGGGGGGGTGVHIHPQT